MATDDTLEVEGTSAVDPSPPPPPSPTPVPAQYNPWERFGWVMSVIWLVFLAFPISAALTQPTPAKVLGIATVAVFAAVYVYAFVWFPRRGARLRTRTITLGVLVALCVILSTAIGIQSIGLAPFIVAYSVFHQPFKRAIAITFTAVIVMAVFITLADAWQYLWIVVAIVLLVALATGATRWIEVRQFHHTQLENQYRLVTEQERVARDVHDVLGHSLTVITVKSELARRLIDVDPAQAAAEVAEIESLSREALSEIRATVAGLRIVRLDEEIERARTALHSAGIAGEFPADPSAIDPRHRMVAAWVLREAVTNVVRHSRAHTCWVEFGPDHLMITDDGEGVNRTQADDRREEPAAGTGLQGARERVEASGGTLRIAPGPAGGTKVEVRW